MQSEYLHCNFLEAKQIADQKQKAVKNLEHQLSQAKNLLKRIDYLIQDHEENSREWIVKIPVDIVVRNERTGAKRINWKKIIMELIEKYNMPMSSDLLYNKVLLNYDEVPTNRHFVLKNISAALHYLSMFDDKLFRTKEKGKKEFIYGLKHFFDFKGNLKQNYLSDYKRESGSKVEEFDNPKIATYAI